MSAQPPQRYELRANADPTVMRVIPELAAEIGLNESILLLQIAYWIKISDNQREGEYWTFQSVRGIQDTFTFWSIDTINRAVNNLIGGSYIKARTDFNKRKHDKTRWFALNTDGLAKLTSISVVGVTGEPVRQPVRKSYSPSESRTTLPQNRTTLPETSTETTTESKDVRMSDGGQDGTSNEPAPPPPTIPSKESQAVSSAKTTQPPSSARPPSRQRFKVFVNGGEDRYADGTFIRVDTPDYADACNGIFYAWFDALEELGRRPDTSIQTLWDKNREAVFALAQNRRTPEQVAAFVRYAYSDKFKDDFYRRNPAPISLQAITGSIAGWLSKQKPKQTISFEEHKPLYPERERLSPEDIARRLAMKEQILAEGS